MAEKVVEGVFIEGKPLEQYLEDAERDEKSRAVEEVRKAAEKREKPTHGAYADERKIEETRRVRKRVRRWTDREIRKEYGIMEKPFDNHAENAIWVIMEKGPVTVKEIGKEMEWSGKANSLSAMVATVWARLGNKHEGAAGVLDRVKLGMSHAYKKADGVDVSVEAANEKYKLVGRAQHQIKMAKKKGDPFPSTKPKPTKPEDETFTNTPSTMASEFEGASAIVDELEQSLSRQFGMDIHVEGKIDIVFKFGG